MLKSYFIGYEFEELSQKRSDLDLIAAIEKLANIRRRCLDKVWLIKSDSDVADIRDLLAPHFRANDKLIVAELSGYGAWIGFKGDDWLVNNF